MEIEWLKIRVNPELREKFVQQDAEIWTAALAQYPGFLHKEVWISPENLAEVILVIHWDSLEDWKSVPVEHLKQIEAQFDAVMGNTYAIVEGSHYQVRKHH